MGENKASLPSEELDRYRKQYELVCDVCSEYDAETSVDSDEVKKKRFEKLLSLMQQVHVTKAAKNDYLISKSSVSCCN